MQNLDALDIEGATEQPARSIQQLRHRGTGERGVAQLCDNCRERGGRRQRRHIKARHRSWTRRGGLLIHVTYIGRRRQEPEIALPQ